MVLKIPPPPPVAKMDPTLNRWFLEVTAILNNFGGGLNQSVLQASGILQAANNLSDVASAPAALANLAGAPLASPHLSGTPTAPTAAPLTDDAQLATTAYVDTAVAVVAAEISSGSWTPTLLGSTGAGAPTYTVQIGSYEQVGRTITARFTVQTSALGGPTGNMEIGGLPFVSANVTNDNGHCFITYMDGVTLDASYVTLTGIILPSTSVIALYEQGSGQTGKRTPVAGFAAATTLQGTAIYHV